MCLCFYFLSVALLQPPTRGASRVFCSHFWLSAHRTPFSPQELLHPAASLRQPSPSSYRHPATVPTINTHNAACSCTSAAADSVSDTLLRSPLRLAHAVLHSLDRESFQRLVRDGHNSSSPCSEAGPQRLHSPWLISTLPRFRTPGPLARAPA